MATSSLAKLSDKEINLIEQFWSLYNDIDRHLRRITGKDKTVPFSALVGEYSRKRKGWVEKEAVLRTVGDLRNCIIHEKTKPYEYCAVPTPTIVEEMEQILRELKNPPLVIPKFQRKVETIKPVDSIADVLRRIDQNDYSQFPVYDDKTFKGLLTENGITRWLAHYLTEGLSMIELSDATVKEALREEEKRKNWEFVGKNKMVDEVKALFRNNNLLEAVLITETGKQSESLLGIATRWDIPNL